MVDYEKLVSQINARCIACNGAAFEVDNMIPKVYWSKKYRGKKFLLGCRWKYVESDGRCEDVERILDQLPKGIQYKKETVTVQALPEKAEQYQTAYESFATTYTIVVTEAYAKKFKQNHHIAGFVVSNVFDRNTLRAAEEFERRISASHPGVIQTLSQRMGTYGILSNNGFDYEGGVGLASVGMKPLSCEAQRLGLALAVAKCGAACLPGDRFYYIDRYGKKDEFSEKTGAVLIQIKNKETKDNRLKDW